MKRIKINTKIVFNMDEQGHIDSIFDVEAVKVSIDRFKQITNISKLCFLLSLIIYTLVLTRDFQTEFINPLQHVICVAASLVCCIRAFVIPCTYGDEDE